MPRGDLSISLIKFGQFQDLNGDGEAEAGELIAYTFTVTNTSGVTLTNITIDDPLVDVEGGPIDLDPGENDTTTFTATYILTEQDIENTFVVNQAVVTGFNSINNEQVSDVSDTGTDTNGEIIEDPESVETDSGLTGTNPNAEPNGDPTDDPTVVILESVLAEDELEIFNGISANEDTVNDIFRIVGIENFPDNTVQIFNRWGVEVFNVEGYNNNERAFRGFSDGRITIARNQRLPAGTYYFVINYLNDDGENLSQAGFLYISE